MVRIEQDVLTRFYQPIILEKALTKIHEPYKQYADVAPALQEDALLSTRQAFQAFVNKLAQACDSEPHGATVTAVAILRNPNNFPLYVVASNFRNDEALQDTRRFLSSLLETIRQEREIGRRPLLKKILWSLLSFNSNRVKSYLGRLVHCLDECLEKCGREQALEVGSPMPDVAVELLLLRARAVFPRDFSNQNEKIKFLSDCETCIKMIHAARGKTIDEAIRSQSSDSDVANSRSWHELRHCLGRLLSYRQAAEILLGAFDRWPLLFTDFEVVTIPSSMKASRPLPRSDLTAEEIIINMAHDSEETGLYLRQAYDLQLMGLDDRIQMQVNRKIFRPVVHAEVALHTHLLRIGVDHPSKYWNDYKYIGFAVRDSHDNLYATWQFPPTPIAEGRMGREASEELLEIMTVLVCNDAKRSLDERRPRGRDHDSNTHSTIPSYLNVVSHGTSTDSSSHGHVERSNGLQRGTDAGPYEEESWDIYESDSTETDDEIGNEGASVLEEYY
ncbi:hypothetical protein LQW54_008294 [Pestalotiopsis sp. IQ-011]